MPLFAHRLPQKHQHGSQLGGHFFLRGIARMAAGFGGVEPAIHADFAQAGVEFERVGGVHAVVAQIGSDEGGRVGLSTV